MAFQLHARMLNSKVAQSLKCYGHFSDLRVRIALSHSHVEFFGESKYINLWTRRGRHGSPVYHVTFRGRLAEVADHICLQNRHVGSTRGGTFLSAYQIMLINFLFRRTPSPYVTTSH